jgi:predicted transcriptional regulator of viral defense system
MKWQDLLGLVGGSTLFDASTLLSGPDSPSEVHRQLSRWVASGRVIQLRRGLYALAPPFARASPNRLSIASRIRRPSYVSLQSALSYHGAIPESVSSVTSVTTGRPGRVQTQLGDFLYRHLGPGLFWGYSEVEVAEGGSAYVALPEKAVLDLFYFTSGPIRASFVQELRLASGALDSQRLQRFADRAARPKLVRAAALTVRVLAEERQGETLL